MHRPTRQLATPTAALAALSLLVGLVACSTDDGADDGPEGAPTSTTSGPTETPTEDPSAEDGTATEETSPEPPREPRPDPLSVAALAQADLTGGGLRIGAVREQTAGFTSYDVTFRSTVSGRGTRPLTISGVLNVPAGRGPHPAVVLAHGYIDPAFYVRGQGMTRERGYLAERGFVTLHVDYRNHAESTDDTRLESAVRLGYTADVVAGVRALRASDDVRVDPDRIALFGRSMGGGVVLKALATDPDLVAAGVAWASVSSLEAENYQQFMADDPERAEMREAMRRRHGLPGEAPAFWRGLSARPTFDDITAPVLLAHGRLDDTCPPIWARESQRALTSAGVDSTLRWYDDGHAFGPAFVAAMDDTVAFLRRAMPA